MLRFFEDLKLEEIAEILDQNINTVKTRLYKALEILRLSMDDEEIRRLKMDNRKLEQLKQEHIDIQIQKN